MNIHKIILINIESARRRTIAATPSSPRRRSEIARANGAQRPSSACAPHGTGGAGRSGEIARLHSSRTCCRGRGRLAKHARCAVSSSLLLLAPGLVLAWAARPRRRRLTRTSTRNIPRSMRRGRRDRKPGAPVDSSLRWPPTSPGPRPSGDAGADTSSSTPPPVFAGTLRGARRRGHHRGDVRPGPGRARERVARGLEQQVERALARRLTLRDGAGRTARIAGDVGGVVVAPNAYVVSCAIGGGDRRRRSRVRRPLRVRAKLSSSEGIQLANGARRDPLFDGESEIASAAYGSYQLTNVGGRSAQGPTTAANGSFALATPGALGCYALNTTSCF